jgi:hypothetical protein
VNLADIEKWFVETLAPDVRGWFSAALAQARREGLASEGFAIAWSGAGRRLGRAAIELTAAEAATLRGAPFVPVGWGRDELGRGLLLLAGSAGTEAEKRAAAVDELFRMGEMREQQAVLRVLPYLPEPASYAALAADAVRSNVLSVLEAIACDNPFPAAHLNELAFNQLVMKSIFNGIALRRIIGLAERNNDDLRRIVRDFSSERRAAGRPVPPDLELILG